MDLLKILYFALCIELNNIDYAGGKYEELNSVFSISLYQLIDLLLYWCENELNN